MSYLSNKAPAQRRKLKNRTDCEICKKNFDSVQSLIFHKLKDHQDDENPANAVNEEVSLQTSIGVEMKPEPPRPQTTRRTRSSVKEQAQSSTKRIKVEKETEIVKVKGKRQQGAKVLQEFIIDNRSMLVENNTPVSVKGSDKEETSASCMEGTDISTEGTAIQVPSPLDAEKAPRKSLAESLVAAVVDEGCGNAVTQANTKNNDLLNAETMSADDLKLKFNVRKLLDIMVDKPTLEKLGWPEKSEEDVSISYSLIIIL